jgi:hypothetical protein
MDIGYEGCLEIGRHLLLLKKLHIRYATHNSGLIPIGIEGIMALARNLTSIEDLSIFGI